MGNAKSLQPFDRVEDEEYQERLWWGTTQQMEEPRETRQKRMKEELDEFKLELARKHEKRRELIRERKTETMALREEVARLRQENEALRRNGPEELQRLHEELKREREASQEARTKNRELMVTVAAVQGELQNLNGEMVNFEKERAEYQTHVNALKDVIAVSKQMLMIRETQLKELRQKVSEIEASLAGRELSVLSQDLRSEYERQLQNIRNLRIFYDERQRADAREKGDLRNLLDETKKELESEQHKNNEHKETIDRLEEENSKKYDEIKSLESTLGLTKAECRQYQAELSVINQLFSQILQNNNTQEFNVDKLIKLLEENHDILQDIAINEVSNEVSALPKILLDLVTEVNDKDSQEELAKKDSEPQVAQLSSASEIVENLPKVWKVLIELLSHQCAPINTISNEENPCYKLVQTPKGPNFVLSVSQTFIRLKDLILEKKSLERETCRMKQLNTHLECRLSEQEKRLEMVTNELSETWHVVGKLQKKHQLLHTQEKILRYELAQKRKLLTELKEELEYSREKWAEARAKNSNTEKQWEELRLEFASRKTLAGDESVESGYSDGRECSSEDEPGYETDVSECHKTPETSEDQATIAGVIHCEIESIENDEGNSDLQTAPSEDAVEDGKSTPEEEPPPEEEVLLEEVVAEVVEAESIPKEERPPERGVSLEDVLSAREQRLLRLEGQASSLVRQMASTSTRSKAISNKLDALHEIYGESSRTTTAANGDDDDDAEETPKSE